MSGDKALKQKVLDELKWDPSINAAHVGITANDGIVTLTGRVESFAEKHAAEKAAGRVVGVKAVAEEIEVKLPFSSKRGDDEIAASALERLSWDTFVPPDVIKVKVEKGWITLSGEVDWAFEKNAAGAALSNLYGVIGVSNDITITSKANASDISTDIKLALDRSWFSAPNHIKVTVDGGDVNLTGTVHSWEDKRKAAFTAWAAPGATYVQNDLSVV